MKISLIAVDLDGTLLTDSKKLAPIGASLLSRASRQGIRVVLSTAREPTSVRTYCAEMDLHDPIICTGGAQVWSAPDGELWSAHTLPYAEALAIAEYADQNGWELNTTIGTMTFWKQRPGQPLGLVAPNRIVVSSNTAAFHGKPADVVRILVFDPEAIIGLDTFCHSQSAQACRTEIFVDSVGRPETLGIFPLHCDKGSALRLVIERLGIPAREVMAIGDNMVDVPMFDVAYLSVAMGNSPARVKQLAGAVAPTNDQEGVAWAVNEFVFSALN